MRKTGLVTVSALALAISAPVVAQYNTSSSSIPSDDNVSAYVVQEGDNPWMLADVKLGNPELWHWLVEQNPDLKKPERNFIMPNGGPGIRIYPGEMLYGLDEAGISLDDPNRIVVQASRADLVGAEVPVSSSDDDWSWLWWLLLPLGLVALLAWLWLRRELRKDPVESGPPQVRGGISSTEQAHERFAQRGFRQHFQVLHTVPGTISGTMRVRYGDGSVRPRTLDRQRAFQATVRHEDGRTEDLYMLQACGNDLLYGGIDRYLPGSNFRFVPDQSVEAPALEEVVPPAAPAVASEVAEGLRFGNVPESMMESSAKPELKIELKPAESTEGTAMVRVTGAPTEDMVLTIGEDSFTLRFHPPKKG